MWIEWRVASRANPLIKPQSLILGAVNTSNKNDDASQPARHKITQQQEDWCEEKIFREKALNADFLHKMYWKHVAHINIAAFLATQNISKAAAKCVKKDLLLASRRRCPFAENLGFNFFEHHIFPQCEIQSIWKGLYESGKWEREVRKGGRNLSWFFVINRCSFTCVWGYTKNGDWKTSHMKGEQYCLGKI